MRSYTIQLPCIELLAPDDIYGDKVALKEYTWSHWKDEIQRRLIVELPSIPTTIENNNCSNRSLLTQLSFNFDGKSDHTPVTIDTEQSESTHIATLARNISQESNTHGIISSPNHSLPKKVDLLNTIARVQRQFFYSESPKVVFGTLLDALLALMDSEYGFIGEVKVNEKTGKQYLHNHAVTNIAWDDATRKFYDDNVASGLVFTNLHSLFGKVITTASPVISNDPKTDKRGCGIPKGHPPLDHFLGIPFFMPGGELNGMVGISNKPGGYIEDDIEFLEPFTVTCGNLIHAFNQINENKYLINTLETSVKKRTHELEQANIGLEEANRLVIQANKMQLQHFACMSHEIRTPLNCVIGMASVLQDSKLIPMQKEAVGMIVNSGELLLGIINDVLDYSKYETENVSVHKQSSSLQDTVTLVLNAIETKALPTQSIQSFFDVTVPENIHTDTRRLQQILFNLLGNAIKFSPADGIIKLRIEMMSLQNTNDGIIAYDSVNKINEVKEPSNTSSGDFAGFKADSMASDEQKMIRFIVEDNGKGIDENDLKRIFQPFQQASSTAENVYGGTGLGLSITQKIVSALGGAISAASKKGEWSKFTFDIPSADPPVSITDISHKVKNYIVHVVGFCEAEKTIMDRILKSYSMERSYFGSLSDILNVFEANTLHPENVHIILLREDCYDPDKVLAFADSTLVTVGPTLCVKENSVGFHIHSLEHLLPSYFVNALLRTAYEKKQRMEIPAFVRFTPTTENSAVSSYSEMKVLIAEDNVVNQKVLTRILNKLNVKNVDIVENGLEACKKEEEVVYDLIFMDQQMPIMGGVAACRHILGRYIGKNAQNQQRPTIVFVTAHVSADFKNECLDAGGSGFVSKPFNLSIIEQSLISVYEQRHAK